MRISQLYASARITSPPSLEGKGSKTQQTSGAGGNARGVQSSISAHRLAVKDNARNHVLMNAGDKALTGVRDAYSLQSASQRGAIAINTALLAQLGAASLPPLPPTPHSQAAPAAPMPLMSPATLFAQLGAPELELPPSPLPQAALRAPMPAMNAATHLAQSGSPLLPPPPPPLPQAVLGAPMNATTLPARPGAQELRALPPLPQAMDGASMPPIRATTSQPIPRAPASAGPSTPGATSRGAAPPRNRATTIVQTRSIDPYTGFAFKGKTLDRFNANRIEHTPTFTRMANVARFIAAQEGLTTLKCLKLPQSESPDFGFGFAILKDASSSKTVLMSERERIDTYIGLMSILDNVSLRPRVDPLTLAVMDNAIGNINRKFEVNESITADDVREAFTMISMDLSIPEADAAQTAEKMGLKELETLRSALATAGHKEIRFLADDRAVSGVGIKAIEPKGDAHRIMLKHSDDNLKVHELFMRQRASDFTHQLLLALLDKWDENSMLLTSTKAAIGTAKRLMATRLSEPKAYIQAYDVEDAFSRILADMQMYKTL
ncbi:MAG: hypothetical protein JWR21_3101 [Herminiimonas sp.]|nr:hypothetical protein [Herminiimonas sp.]